MVLLLCITACTNAQFSGGFYHADPDAWFDKEPYFACRNLFAPYGWGQNFQNVTAVVNGSEEYSLPGVWTYGTWITLGKDSGVDFESGDTVSIYIGGYYVDTWKYTASSTLSGIHIPGSGKILKKLWRYIKRIR